MKKKNDFRALILFFALMLILFAAPSQTNSAPRPTPVIVNVVMPAPTTVESDVLKESQRLFDRTLTILDVAIGAIGVLASLIAIILAVFGVIGFFEYKKLKKFRKDTEAETKEIKAKLESFCKVAEEKRDQTVKDADETAKHAQASKDTLDEICQIKNELSETRNIIKVQSLTEKPSEETKEQLSKVSENVERLKALGADATAVDYFNYATDLYYKGKYEEAIKALEEAISIKPDYAEAWLNKGVALSKLNKHEESLKAHEEAIRIMPDYAGAWYNKGVALNDLGKVEEAIKTYEEAIKIKPDYADAWSNKGAALANLGKYEEAIKALEEAISIKPDYAGAWYNKGVALNDLDKHEEAIKAYEEAIRIKPDFAGAWFNKACVFSLMGKKEDTLINLKEAVRLDIKFKQMAKEDEDFKSLWDDEEFKRLVS